MDLSHRLVDVVTLESWFRNVASSGPRLRRELPELTSNRSAERRLRRGAYLNSVAARVSGAPGVPTGPTVVAVRHTAAWYGGCWWPSRLG